MTTPASRYAAKPWLALLNDAQRAPIEPADSLVHAFRGVRRRGPGPRLPSPTSTGG